MNTTERPQLIEFQARLAEKLQGVQTEARSDAWLAVQVGSYRWLIDMTEAGEIVPAFEIQPVPLTRTWFRGLVNLRGNLLTVIDPLRFLGDGEISLGKDCRLVAFNPRLGMNAAMLVSRMLGLRSKDELQAGDEPEVVGSHWMGQMWLDSAGHEWRQLRLRRLCREEDFLAVARYPVAAAHA